MEKDYEYRCKYVEIYIDGADYVEWDLNQKKEIVRRKATEEEFKALETD